MYEFYQLLILKFFFSIILFNQKYLYYIYTFILLIIYNLFLK